MPFDGAAQPVVRIAVARRPFARPEMHELPHVAGKGLGYYLDDIGLEPLPGCGLGLQVARGATARERRVRNVAIAGMDEFVLEPSDLVAVAVVPGKGGKSPFRLLLSLASFALSFNVFGLPFLAGTLFSVGSFTLSVGQALGFALTLIGGLFAPRPKPPSSPAPDPQAYSIAGSRNAADPFGAVPRLYGRHRIWPKLGAKPFTEIVGNDQFLNLLFNCGYAPMRVSELKIGETPIAEYAGVEIEMRGVIGQSLRLADGAGPATMTVPAASIEPMKDSSFTVEFRLTVHDGGSTGVRRHLVHKGKTVSTCTFSAHLAQGHARRLAVMFGDGAALQTVTGPDLDLGRSYHVALRWAKSGDLEEDGESAETPRRHPGGRGGPSGGGRERPPKKPKPAPPPPPGRLALFVDGAFVADSGDLGVAPVWDAAQSLAIEADDGADFSIDELRLWHAPRADDHIEFYAGTSLIGSEPNLTALFEFDHGDARDYSSRKIAAGTLAGNCSFVDGQIHSSTPMTLFRNDVNEEAFAVTLKQADGWVTRTTAGGAEEIGVDVLFPQGLVHVSGSGSKTPTTVEIEVQYRPAGTGTWLDPVWLHQGEAGFEHLVAAAGGNPAKLSITDAKAALVRRNGTFRPAGPGQYDVRLRRITADNETNTSLSDEVQWSVLRSVAFVDPIRMNDVVKIALRLKASEQLHQIVDSFNLVGEAYLAVWDGSIGDYRLQLTRDAAWAYVDALTGPAAPNPIGYDRIDTPAFVAWAADNEAAGRHFDMYFAQASTTFEVLNTIAAAGRASFAMTDNRYSVARDVPQSVPVQQFTPHNSFDFQGEHLFLDRPHALRVKFINAEAGYKADERIVYMDGWDETTASRFQPIQIDGIVEPAIVFKEARYLAAVSILRPENYSWGADLEHLVCRPGSLVNVVHFAADFGLSSGRVRSATTTGVSVDAPVPMVAGALYGIRFRYQDGTLKDFALAPKALDGEYTLLDFADEIDAGDVPVKGDLFATGDAEYVGEDIVVTRIVPIDEWRARVHGAPAAAALHEIDAGPIPPWTSNLSTVPEVHRRPLPPVILGIVSDESAIERLPDGGLRSRMILSLAPQADPDALEAAEFEAEFRQSGGGDWSKAPKAVAGETTIDLAPVDDGTGYEIRARSISRLGVSSEWTGATHTVVGQTTPPPSPPGLMVERVPNGLRRYRIVPYELPVDHAGWHFRWRAGAALPSWSAGTPAHTGVWTTDSFEAAAFADRSYVVMAKAVDRGGRESDSFAWAVVDLGDAVYDAIEESFDERTAVWPGERIGCTVASGDLVADSSAVLFDAPGDPLFEDPDDALFGGFSEMIYRTVWTPTLPGFLHLDWASNKSAVVAYSRPGSEPVFVDPNAAIFTDPDAPFLRDGAELAYQGPFAVTAGMAIHASVRLAGGATQAELTQLKAIVEAETEIEHLNDVEILAAGTRLPITKPFTRILGVSLTLQDDVAYDAVTARRLDLDADLGPLVKCFDASNVATDGLVDASVRGVV